MTKLLWDKIGERFFEAGVDRGVLYLADDSGVAWSGLISVDESFDDDSNPAYLDGIKQRDDPNFGNLSATITAYTYPDEFIEYEGSLDLSNGLIVEGQRGKPFSLSYRSLIGNDLESTDHGYQIHIFYNLIASPDDIDYATIEDTDAAIPFSWSVSSIPQNVDNYRPTSHVILDTRYLHKDLVEDVESILYGNSIDAPRLMSINELINFVTTWNRKGIDARPDTGLSVLFYNGSDLNTTLTDGIYTALPEGRLTPSSVEGLYILS